MSFGFGFGFGGGVGRQSVEKSNDEARQFYNKLFGRPLYKASRRNRTRQNIVHTRFDRAVWEEAKEIDDIREGITDLYVGDPNDKTDPKDPDDNGRVNWENAPEGVQDLFYTLYKTAPRFEKKGHLHKSVWVTRKILEEILGMQEFQSLHEKTSMDPVLSSMAVEQMFPTLRDIIKRLEEGQGGGGGDSEGEGEGEGEGGGAISKSNQEREKEDEQEGKGDGEGEEGDGDEGEGTPPDVLDEDDLLDDLEREFDDDLELADESEELIREWDELDDLFDEQGIDRMLNRLLEQVNDDLNAVESFRKDIGLDDGQWKTMDPKKRYQLADFMASDKMKLLAAKVGRMKQFALGVRHENIIEAPNEIYDVELGQDIRRVLRSQFAMLAMPETKYEFYRRFYDRELFQYKTRGREEAGKGPIVVAIDKSGSMHGDPFDWAMAVGEALRRICADENRDYYVMFFGNNNDRERFDFPKGETDMDKVMSFLSADANGGTQFDGVLNEALERCKQQFDEDGKSNADIVFITDGCAYLDEDWITRFNESREEIGTHVYSVYVTGARDAYRMESMVESGPVRLLQSVSDEVFQVTDLTGNSVADIFKKV